MEEPTIGALAGICGVNVETVRFYQRRGLLAVPPRAARGARRYGEDAVRRLRFIRRAQLLGFSLDEIADLLRLERMPDCNRARRLAAAKLADIERKLAGMDRVRRSLAALVEACAAAGDARRCPIVESLGSTDEAADDRATHGAAR